MDSKIPFLEAALTPHQALPKLQTVNADIQHVIAATLLRHKLGRRALIAYDLETSNGPLTLIGKIRAKGTDEHSYDVQRSLWEQGFTSDSLDGLSVPEPIGSIPEWQMWLQRKVSGVPATKVLPTSHGVAIAKRIARLAKKLHCSPIVTDKTHTLNDELRILQARLPLVGQQYPQWNARLKKLLKACEALACSLPRESPITGIHRDFYSDQILVERNGHRLWLVDLDLYCYGHPALDIGNFIAHMTEQSIRQSNNSAAMIEQKTALTEKYINTVLQSVQLASLSLSEQDWRQAIAVYTELALVRHIHISTRIPSRNTYTESLLRLCESHLNSTLSN